MTNYPTSLDSLINPSSGDTTAAVDHAAQHANVNDAVEALEAKLGIGSSVAASNKLLRGTGAGASAWDKDAPTGTIVGDTDTQTLTNKTLTSPTINTAIINNPTLATNTISEYTAASGVTIDGMLIKDSKLATSNSVVTSNITDDAVTAAKIDWATTGANGGIWWEELGRTTLGTAGDTISVTSIAARRYLRVQIISIGSGVISQVVRFNNDSATNYAYRAAINGGADSSSASATGISLTNGDTNNIAFVTIDVMNNTTTEKMLHADITLGPTGAANIPPRVELSGKWANTASQITRVDLINTNTGDFAIGSEVVVLGHN